MKLRKQKGFSVIEVIVSLGIFSIVSAMMSTGIIKMQRANYDNSIRTGAFSAAQRFLDRCRSLDPAGTGASTITGECSTPTDVTIADRVHTVVPRICENPLLCPSPSVKSLKAEVFFKGIKRYEVETVFARLN